MNKPLLALLLTFPVVGCAPPEARAPEGDPEPPGSASDETQDLPGPDVDHGKADGGDADTTVPTDVERPLDIMDPERLARFASILPTVADEELSAILESPDTMWYDRQSIVPGYQDSFGDNRIAPIGMRPNTIRSSLIDTAVPGGHAKLFKRKGVFHFPFGRTGGADAASNTYVIDFWQLPRVDGELLPVKWWWRRAGSLTHRIEWVFPVGTVFGEVIFIIHPETDEWVVFELRTRTREREEWDSAVYRPFPTAEDLATALEEARGLRESWSEDPQVDDLVAHLRDPSTLEPATLRATHFRSAFETRHGAEDVLPTLSDPSILTHLLRITPFRKVGEAPWKQDGELKTWAPTTHADFSIVPRNYEAGFFAPTNEDCETCHRDAGRPIGDFYPELIAYGELWGEDDTFSWHPFETDRFVRDDGRVRNFNHDNREIRDDFVEAGLVEHAGSEPSGEHYARLEREWKDYAH